MRKVLFIKTITWITKLCTYILYTYKSVKLLCTQSNLPLQHWPSFSVHSLLQEHHWPTSFLAVPITFLSQGLYKNCKLYLRGSHQMCVYFFVIIQVSAQVIIREDFENNSFEEALNLPSLNRIILFYSLLSSLFELYWLYSNYRTKATWH